MKNFTLGNLIGAFVEINFNETIYVTVYDKNTDEFKYSKLYTVTQINSDYDLCNSEVEYFRTNSKFSNRLSVTVKM